MHLKAHLMELEEYGFTEAISEAHAKSAASASAPSVRAFAERLGGWMKTRFPALPMLTKAELSAAGLYDVSEELVHGYRAMAAVGLPGTILLLLMAGGGKLSALQVLLMVLLFMGGWQLPSIVLRRRGAARLDEVDRQLPELIDLLIATIEAGMGFAAATKLVSERMAAPLGDELRLTLRQQSLGMSMGQALEGMGDRCDTPSVRVLRPHGRARRIDGHVDRPGAPRALLRSAPAPPSGDAREDAEGADQDAVPGDVPDHAGPDDRADVPRRIRGHEEPFGYLIPRPPMSALRASTVAPAGRAAAGRRRLAWLVLLGCRDHARGGSAAAAGHWRAVRL